MQNCYMALLFFGRHGNTECRVLRSCLINKNKSWSATFPAAAAFPAAELLNGHSSQAWLQRVNKNRLDEGTRGTEIPDRGTLREQNHHWRTSRLEPKYTTKLKPNSQSTRMIKKSKKKQKKFKKKNPTKIWFYYHKEHQTTETQTYYLLILNRKTWNVSCFLVNTGITAAPAWSSKCNIFTLL